MLPIENELPGLIVADEARVAELASKLGVKPKYPFPEFIEERELPIDTSGQEGQGEFNIDPGVDR